MKDKTYLFQHWPGGKNTYNSAYHIKTDELQETYNVRLQEEGDAVSRPGYSLVNASPIDSNYVTAIHQYQDDYGNKTTYNIDGSKLYSLVGTTPTEVTDALGNKKVLSNNQRASMFTWKEKLFVSNGNEPAFQYGQFEYNVSNVIFLANTGNNQVLKCNSDGTVISKFGTNGSGNGSFIGLSSVVADYRNGFFYTAETGYPVNGGLGLRVQKFDLNGFWQSTVLSSYGTICESMDIDSTGNLYVAYNYPGGLRQNGIIKYDKFLNFIAVTSILSTGVGASACHLSIDNTNSKIYFASVPENKIYIRNLNLTASSSFSGPGSTDGLLNGPWGIWVDPTGGLVYVSDNGNSRIQTFNLAGTYQSKWSATNPFNIWGSHASGYLWMCQDTNAGALQSTVVRTSLTGTGAITVDYTTLVSDVYGFDSSLTQNNIACFKDLGSPLSPTATNTMPYSGTATSGGTAQLIDTSFDFTTCVTTAVGAVVTNTTTGLTGTVGSLTGTEQLNISGLNFTTGDGYSFSVPMPSGNPSGTYKYKITYATKSGLETTGGIESNPITVSSQWIHLINLSTSPMSTLANTLTGAVDRKYVYRAYSSDGGATYGSYKYVAEVLDTAGDPTVCDDNIANGSESDVIPSVNTLVPTFKYLLQFKDCLFGAGDYNNPNYLYWTNASSPNNPNSEDDWEIYSWMPVGEGEKGFISGLAGLGNDVLVFKDNSVWRISFTVSSTTGQVSPLSPVCVSPEYGCISHFAWDYISLHIKGKKFILNGIIFPDKDKGFCFTNGYFVFPLGDNVLPDWKKMDKTLLKNAVGKYLKNREEFWVAVTSPGQTTNDQVWVYNSRFQAIYAPWTIPICSMNTIEDSNGVEQLYGGNFAGSILQLDTGNSDNTTAIDKYLTTGWYSFGIPANTKVFDKIFLDFMQKGTWNMTVYWAVDGNAFISQNSIDISLAGTDGVRDKYIIRPVDYNTGRTLTGKSVAIRIRNNQADQPFDVSGVGFEVRIYKAFVP